MKMYGIRYRGRHSREWGLVVTTKSRPGAPPVRTIEETVPYRDGALDYSNQAGRLYYDDRLVELEFAMIRPELREMQETVSAVVNWFSGWYGDLIFDDMPYTVWEARPIEIGDPAMELYKAGRMTVQFRCRPFNRLLFSNRGIPIGADIPLGAKVRLGFGRGQYHLFPTQDGADVHHYIGTAPVAPVITFMANTFGIGGLEAVHGMTLTLNGATLTYPDTFTNLRIDCAAWRAESDGKDVTARMAGDYPELLPGDNTFTLAVDANVQMDFYYIPRYLYGTTGMENL